MLKHRSLTLHKFVTVVSPDVLHRYFERINMPNAPDGWQEMNGDALEAFLARPENAEPESLIRQDFERVNDIAGDGVGMILRASKRFGIAFDEKRTTEENAFCLFLDHPDAFDYAWTRFLLYASSSKLSVHPIGGHEFRIEGGGLERFEVGVRSWFQNQAKGDQAQVSHFDDDGDDVILIRHGTYYRAFSHWEEEGLGVVALRLAVEDVIAYERDTGLLRIKATQPKDRMEYLRLFARDFVGNEDVAQEAADAEVFNLGPIQSGEFDFNGDGPIARVELKAVRLKIYGLTNPIVDIRSKDVLAAIKYDLGGLGLDSGMLVSAKLKFTIQRQNKPPTSRTFEITPPSYTNLPDRRDTQLILEYLQRQGVKLK